jgi:hypothetical protein
LRVERHQPRDRYRVDRWPDELAVPVLRAFAPIDKRALGVAVGVVSGVALFAFTGFHALMRPATALPLELLAQYFYAYEVTWRGAFVGLFWGFFTGFVAGWFIAFTRNLAMATMAFILKTKGELANTRDFLDHI